VIGKASLFLPIGHNDCKNIIILRLFTSVGQGNVRGLGDGKNIIISVYKRWAEHYSWAQLSRHHPIIISNWQGVLFGHIDHG